ncbi:hypothetical protein [Tahibacter amnicola]|uniref:Tetratricopeptide repeat protein n=1 Tax=Tahibacter amnicola TaxID=2976241 RepID=A0ABY6B9Q3_9GAMM|nr:hypothetical protein [Tahibacter amnicola]UXI66584.1 hypothetical protein N4264_17755 [Tahibacter amnicola]
MPTEIDTLYAYLGALENAAEAIDQARRIRPDIGLDHAMSQLRAMVARGGMEMQRLLEATEAAMPSGG